MVFKQKISEDVKVLLIASGVVMFLYSLMLPIAFACVGSFKAAFISFPITFLIFLLIDSSNLDMIEWFFIYDDKIEVRGIFGIKNTVYLRDIKYVEDIYFYFCRSTFKHLYIFDDGREEKINRKKWTNKKKRSFRIYKTPELENFLKEKNIEIRYVKPDWQ